MLGLVYGLPFFPPFLAAQEAMWASKSPKASWAPKQPAPAGPAEEAITDITGPTKPRTSLLA